jgi:hypothetical protein
VFDLELQGVDSFAASTPGCRGPLAIAVTERPSAGWPTFAVYCSGAAPNARGALLIGEPISTPFHVAGAGVWVTTGGTSRRISVLSDSDGYVETDLSLATRAPGEQFSCQYLFESTPACAGPTALSASNAITITVQ